MPDKPKYTGPLAEGQPGPFASGTPAGVGHVDRGRRFEDIVGDEVAALFPWLRRIQETITAGQKFAIRDQFDESAFTNISPFPVDIHEIRLCTNPIPNPGPPPTFQVDQRLNLSIGGRKSIIDQWIPWTGLNTESDRHLTGETDSLVWRLPTPYFLSRGHVFVAEFRITADWLSDQGYFYMGLNGYCPDDDEPIQLIKQISLDDSLTAGDIFSVAFDDDRDMTLRNAVIEYISFGGATQRNNQQRMSQIEFRVKPPEGPRWDSGDFFRIFNLVDQVSWIPLLAQFTYGNIVIHRPKVPYRLFSNEKMIIEVWNQHASQEYTTDFVLIGTQRGTK